MEPQSIYLTPVALRGKHVDLDRKEKLLSSVVVSIEVLLQYYKDKMTSQEILDCMEKERNLLKIEGIENLSEEELDSKIFTLATYVKKIFQAGQARSIWKFRDTQNVLKAAEKERKDVKYTEEAQTATDRAKRKRKTPLAKAISRVIELHQEVGEEFNIFKLQEMSLEELKKVEKELYIKL